MMSRDLFFVVFNLALLACSEQSVRISGKIFDTDSNPIKSAIMVFSTPVTKYKENNWLSEGFQPVIQTVQADDNGSFFLLADSSGIFTLTFSAVHHIPQELLLFVPQSERQIEVEIYLAKDDSNEVAVSDIPPGVRFKDEASESSRFVTFVEKIQSNRVEFSQQLVAVKNTGGKDAELRAFTSGYDWTQYHEPVREVLGGTLSTEFKQAALVHYLYETGKLQEMENPYFDPDIATTALEVVEVESPFWSTWPEAFMRLSWANYLQGVDGFQSYFDEILEKHPDARLKAGILAYELTVADFAGNKDKASKLYERLMEQYADSKEAKGARVAFAQDKAIQTGNRVPDFEVASFDDPDIKYSNKSLLGKTYLIDFWGTWCKPCVAEMSYLHDAFAKYGGQGFTILSMACDAVPEKVKEFRRREWQMPWLHHLICGCADGNREAEILKMFEVTGFPTSILIGPSGKILATGSELRQERLEKTLMQVFAARK